MPAFRFALICLAVVASGCAAVPYVAVGTASAANIRAQTRQRPAEPEPSAPLPAAESADPTATEAQPSPEAQTAPAPPLPLDLPEGVSESLAICFLKGLRGELLAEIKTQQRYAAEGAGVINLKEMHDLQREIRFADERGAQIAAVLEQDGVTPLPCNHLLVKKAAICVARRVTYSYPSGTSVEATDRFCAASGLQSQFALLEDLVGEQAPYWKGADQVLLWDLGYHFDEAHLRARSADACMADVLPAFLGRHDPAKIAEARAQIDAHVAAAKLELEQTGLTPLACDDPAVIALYKCEMETKDRDPKTCASAEVKSAQDRMLRPDGT